MYIMYFDCFPSNLHCLMFIEFGKTSIRIKQNPIIFVRHFSSLSDKNFQTVGQLSSTYSENFAKTVVFAYAKTGFLMTQLKYLNSQTPSNFALNTLKLKLRGSAMKYCFQKN